MKTKWWIASGWLFAFATWTVAVCCMDVARIGPQESTVGFATVNAWFHRLTGVHMVMYTITDWFGLVPVAVCMVFAVVGLRQWIVRKRVWCVDRDLLCLGGFYIATIVLYVFFEEVIVNYRPVLIDGYLEASYPSSTTLLVLCVMLTARRQVRWRIQNHTVRRVLMVLTVAFAIFMVVGRLVSGVHWLSDIVGGVLLSFGLVALYDAVCGREKR